MIFFLLGGRWSVVSVVTRTEKGVNGSSRGAAIKAEGRMTGRQRTFE